MGRPYIFEWEKYSALHPHTYTPKIAGHIFARPTYGSMAKYFKFI